MSGDLLRAARADAAEILSSGGFEEEITLTHPSGAPFLTFTGLHTKHWISFDTEGNRVNAQNAHVLISENYLIANGYVTRNLRGKIKLNDHRIKVKDATGITKNYVITETLPSETLGLIVCILGDFKPNA